jgi:hypothetical protein
MVFFGLALLKAIFISLFGLHRQKAEQLANQHHQLQVGKETLRGASVRNFN